MTKADHSAGRRSKYDIRTPSKNLHALVEGMEAIHATDGQLGTFKSMLQVIARTMGYDETVDQIDVFRFLINYGVLLFDERNDTLHFDRQRANKVFGVCGSRTFFEPIDLADRASVLERVDRLLSEAAAMARIPTRGMSLASARPGPEDRPPAVAPVRALYLTAAEAFVWKNVRERTHYVSGAVYRLIVSKDRDIWHSAWAVTDSRTFIAAFDKFVAHGLLTSVGGSAGKTLTYAVADNPNAYAVIETDDAGMPLPPYGESVAALPQVMGFALRVECLPEPDPTMVISTKPIPPLRPAPPKPIPPPKPTSNRRNKKPAFGPLPDDLSVAEEPHLQMFLDVYRKQGDRFASQAALIESELIRRAALAQQ